MNKIGRNAILAVILAVVAFFWIWWFDYLGAKAFWVMLVTFGVCIAYGSSLTKSLPWMTLGGVVGVLLGMVTFYLYMLVFPLYFLRSTALTASAVVILSALSAIVGKRIIVPPFSGVMGALGVALLVREKFF